MAFVETKLNPSSGPTPLRLFDPETLKDPGIELPMWVNVSVKVGENIRNARSTDTLWVQFTLKNIFDGPGMSKIPRPLVVDGKYGDNTKAWIKHFQQDGKAQGLAQSGSEDGGAIFPVHPDGAVSRVPPGSFLLRSGFTAYKLNKVLAIMAPVFWLQLTNAARSNVTLEAFIQANA